MNEPPGGQESLTPMARYPTRTSVPSRPFIWVWPAPCCWSRRLRLLDLLWSFRHVLHRAPAGDPCRGTTPCPVTHRLRNRPVPIKSYTTIFRGYLELVSCRELLVAGQRGPS